MKRRDGRAIYEDRRFKVTVADVRTPTAYYPVADTVGRIRRDILFCALAYSGLTSGALALYHDLWYAHEVLAVVGSIAFSLIAGCKLLILQLDARGFPARFFVARASTVRSIFNAITEARAIQRDRRGQGGDLTEATEQNID